MTAGQAFLYSAIYVILGVGFYKPTRETSTPLKVLYFLLFPVHSIIIPLSLAFASGMAPIIASTAFWVILGILLMLLMR